jgi:hypothetical protein
MAVDCGAAILAANKKTAAKITALQLPACSRRYHSLVSQDVQQERAC